VNLQIEDYVKMKAYKLDNKNTDKSELKEYDILLKQNPQMVKTEVEDQAYTEEKSELQL